MKDMDYYFNNFQTIPEFATLFVLDTNGNITVEGLSSTCDFYLWNKIPFKFISKVDKYFNEEQLKFRIEL